MLSGVGRRGRLTRPIRGCATATELTIRRLSGAVGAEVAGVDLSTPVDEDLRAALRRAWLGAGVLVFRDQSLTAEGFERVARLFGEPAEYPFLRGLAGHPAITE